MNAESLISSIIVSVIGLAIIAVLVSKRANTANVIGAGAGGLANVINAAVSPVTGAAQGGGFPATLFSGSSFGAAFNN